MPAPAAPASVASAPGPEPETASCSVEGHSVEGHSSVSLTLGDRQELEAQVGALREQLEVAKQELQKLRSSSVDKAVGVSVPIPVVLTAAVFVVVGVSFGFFLPSFCGHVGECVCVAPARCLSCMRALACCGGVVACLCGGCRRLPPRTPLLLL